MLRDSNSLKDILLASAIILVLVASRADGQVRAALLTRSSSGAEGAIMALEESREALLEARDAIDAALRRVDETLASLGEVRTRERVLARAPESVPARLPSARDLSDLSSGVVEFAAGLVDGFLPWRSILARADRTTVSPTAPVRSEPPAAESAVEPAVVERAASATSGDPEGAALAGAGPAEAEVRPSIDPAAREDLSGLILEAAGAMLRVLEDSAVRAAREAPAPEGPPPPAGNADRALLPPGDRAGSRGDR